MGVAYNMDCYSLVIRHSIPYSVDILYLLSNISPLLPT